MLRLMEGLDLMTIFCILRYAFQSKAVSQVNLLRNSFDEFFIDTLVSLKI